MRRRTCRITSYNVCYTKLLRGWSGHEEKDVSAEHYRQSSWKLGTVTSTDEMFKNFVEIDGDKYDWRLVRVPDLPLN